MRKSKLKPQPLNKLLLVLALGFFLTCTAGAVRWATDDPGKWHESKRSQVLESIEAYQAKHGVYPETLTDHGSYPQVHVSNYQRTENGFEIELSETRYFPPGSRNWRYTPARGWRYWSESY